MCFITTPRENQRLTPCPTGSTRCCHTATRTATPLNKLSHFRGLLEENAFRLTDRRQMADLVPNGGHSFWVGSHYSLGYPKGHDQNAGLLAELSVHTVHVCIPHSE